MATVLSLLHTLSGKLDENESQDTRNKLHEALQVVCNAVPPDKTFLNRFARCIDGCLQNCTLTEEDVTTLDSILTSHSEMIRTKANCNEQKRQGVSLMCRNWKRHPQQFVRAFATHFESLVLSEVSLIEQYNCRKIPTRVKETLKTVGTRFYQNQSIFIIDGANVLCSGNVSRNSDGSLQLNDSQISNLTQMVRMLLTNPENLVVIVISQRTLQQIQDRLTINEWNQIDQITLIDTIGLDDDNWSIILLLEWSLRGNSSVRLVTNDRFRGKVHLERFGQNLLEYTRDHCIQHYRGTVRIPSEHVLYSSSETCVG